MGFKQNIRQNTWQIGDVLSRQGATNPMLQNRNLADLAYQQQVAQRQGMAGLQGAGLTGTTGGQALMNAIMQGGIQQRSDYLAKETALQEQRQREDLMNLLLGPKFQRKALRNQYKIGMRQQGGGGGGFDWGSLFNLGSGIAGAV